VKRTYGSWLTRLIRAGTTLTLAEHRLLCALVDALPSYLRDIVERQFASYNLVQREIDKRALNFYRVRLGKSGVLPVVPLLRSKLEVAPLVRITAKLAGDSEPLHATLTAVNGRAFSVSFSRAVPQLLETRLCPSTTSLKLGGRTSAQTRISSRNGRRECWHRSRTMSENRVHQRTTYCSPQTMSCNRAARRSPSRTQA
jgi:hypothetical protein